MTLLALLTWLADLERAGVLRGERWRTWDGQVRWLLHGGGEILAGEGPTDEAALLAVRARWLAAMRRAA